MKYLRKQLIKRKAHSFGGLRAWCLYQLSSGEDDRWWHIMAGVCWGAKWFHHKVEQKWRGGRKDGGRKG
jgi:hypothetical protein